MHAHVLGGEPLGPMLARDERRAARFERAARKAQADGRVPALSVALHRADREPWVLTVGDSGNPEHPLDAGQPVPDRLGHQDLHRGAGHAGPRRRAARPRPADLGATSTCPRTATRPSAGCSRTPPASSASRTATSGTPWSPRTPPTCSPSSTGPSGCCPTPGRFHYSNLGFAVLGQLVARLRGGTWDEVLADRILSPLGLTATTVDRAGPGRGRLPGRRVLRRRPPRAAARPRRRRPGRPAVEHRRPTWPAGPRSWPTRRRRPGRRGARRGHLDEMRWPLTTTDETLWAAASASA